MPMVVVGIDGTATSEDAVRFAAHEAQMRGAELRIVYAWHAPLRGAASQLGRGAVINDAPAEQHAESVANAAAEIARGAAPGITIDIEVADGDAATVLTDMSHNAQLLVVGTRGRGDVAAMVLGSVSHHVARSAHCPVAIVPTRSE